MFYRRSILDDDACTTIEQRWYAHREFRSILVHEIEVNATGCTDQVKLQLESYIEPSTDINFKLVGKKKNLHMYQGHINQTEEPTR